MDFGLISIESPFLNNLWLNIFWWVIVAFAIFLFLFLVSRLARYFLKASCSRSFALKQKIFILTVPNFFSDQEEKSRGIKNLLADFESFYANLGGLKAQRGWRAWLFGRQDHWSFEIVAGHDQLVSFYLAAPLYLADYLRQQILAHYPHAQIEEVADYNIFGAQGGVAAGELKLTRDQILPILTHRQLENDPLTAVLNTMAKLPAGQTAAIQFVMRSAKKEWHAKGVKVAKILQQGKGFKQALAAASPGLAGSFLGNLNSWFGGGQKIGEKDQPPGIKQLSPLEEAMIKAIEEKTSKAGLDVNIRIIAFASDDEKAKEMTRQIANSFAQYSNYEYANGFRALIKGAGEKLIKNFIYRYFDEKSSFILNAEEMASLWHLPFPGTEVPNLRWLQAKRLAPPVNLPNEGLILGENIYRGQKTLIRMKDDDRRRHLYVVGMTGTGKSWLMANLAIQDIKAGRGVCVVDPHGSLIEDIIVHIPKSRAEDVIYFDPANIERPIGLNMLEAKNSYEMDFAAQEMINIFYKLLPDPSMAGPMFEHYMRNALLALMADANQPGTLVELPRIFTDENFRREKLKHVQDILVRDFWEREYPASQRGSASADMLSYVISKTGRFVENEMMRNIIGQAKSGFSFREVMDQGKILLMNLSKGRIGETNSNLLGLIAVSKLQMAALGRADLPEHQRNDFYLYIDEFQNFITDSITIILAEARKYKLNLTIGHQYIAQLTQGAEKVKDAVFGNVGTIVSFRVGTEDAEILAKQMAPRVTPYDLMNMERFNAYIRLLIDNAASPAFNMKCFPLPEDSNQELASLIKNLSFERYGVDRDSVISDVLTRSRFGQLGPKPKMG